MSGRVRKSITTQSLRIPRLPLQLGCLLSMAAATSALAQTYTQVQTFPFNFSNSGDSPLVVANSGDFSAMVQPFNPSSGTLVSFRIAWNITMTGSGIAGDPEGSMRSRGVSGNFFFNGIDYGGFGGGDSSSADVGDPISVTDILASSSLFLVSNAGVTDDAGLLAAVMGGSSFPVLWGASYRVEASNVHSLSATAIGNVRVTYTYLPEASTNVAMGFAFAAVGGVAWRRRTTVTPEVAQAATK